MRLCSHDAAGFVIVLPVIQAFLTPDVPPNHAPSRINQYPLRPPKPLYQGSSDESADRSKAESDAIWGLTDIGNVNFGKFGSDNDPHRNLRPQWMDSQAAWLKSREVDFLRELKEVQQRIQGVNIYLVGMPGSGKTTMGRMLGEGLSYRWIDLDHYIEQKVGKTAREIFEQEGEAVWRKQEHLGLGALQTFVQTVVSTGGGVMQSKENLPFLHSGLIVWLDLSPDDIVERMRQSGEIDQRPLLKNADDPVAAISKLYEERKRNYALADVRVSLSGADEPIRALRRVTHRIIEELDLRPPKAKVWEQKRERMKKLWTEMQMRGTKADINTPAPEGGDNPAIAAIAAMKKGEITKTKGFGKDVRRVAKMKGTDVLPEPPLPEPQLPAVGSQGVGFGLGLEEYMKGADLDPSERESQEDKVG